MVLISSRPVLADGPRSATVRTFRPVWRRHGEERAPGVVYVSVTD